MKVKIISGYRRDQEHSIDAEEAHKAYYLFLNPDKRGIFANGLALTGSDVKSVVPDYHGTMGWNPTHALDSDDWNELRNKSVDLQLASVLRAAKEVAAIGEPHDVNEPLSQLIEQKYPRLAAPTIERREGPMKALRDVGPSR